MKDEEIMEKLYKENEEFRRLKDEHSNLEKKLQEFISKPYLTTNEQVEMENIKKKKLYLKDKMYMMIKKYRKEKGLEENRS